MRAKLIAANWKMNGSFALIDSMQKVLSPILEKTTCEVVEQGYGERWHRHEGRIFRYMSILLPPPSLPSAHRILLDLIELSLAQ